ncbi:universal stress protein [Flavimaricola marinus]|uniref:Universal stress protein family protein n=1 Tax=Flavimaricola marinus TaxID=1819565 RepID=A0A238LG84_9RHOB|nr:universal stress protein [Flavimaricola marinus]SMY08628.1 Universal stress protein family protein [Flavimaricola marinus]
MDRITAFIDGSEYAASVCDHAVWAAAQLSMPVSLVHVIGRRNDVSSPPADLSGNLRLGARTSLLEKLSKLDEERAALGRERGRAILDDGAARIAAAGDIDVITKLRNGDLIEAISELEAETRFTILGKRGEAAGFAADMLGSNLDRAVRISKRPVLVANRAFKTPERFVLAYDGSPATERAVERLTAGSVLAGMSCDMLSVGAATPQTRDKLTHAAAALRRAGFEVTEHLETGEPEAVIAKAVVDLKADMLVLGKAGHSRLRQLFIGSTTMELMRTCRVPFCIFP